MTSRFHTWRKSELLGGRSSLTGYYVFPEQSNLPILQAVTHLVEDEPFPGIYRNPGKKPSVALGGAFRSCSQTASDTLLTSAFPGRP